MKSYISIKKNEDFKKVYNNGKSYANKYLVMYILTNNLNYNRYGISVSKKVGNSVIRHRITRLIREISRHSYDEIMSSYDIVIVARKEIVNKEYSQIRSAFIHLLKLHKIYIK